MSDLNSIKPNDDDNDEKGLIPEPPNKEFVKPVAPQVADNANKGMQTMGMAGAIAFSLAVPPFVGWGIGLLLDRHFSAEPLFTLIMVLLGVVSGFVQMIRLLQRIESAENKDKKK